MKVIKHIVYDGSPAEGPAELTAKVKIIVGEAEETNARFYADFNHTVIIPYTTECKNIGEAVEAIKQTVINSCTDFVNSL